MPPSPEQDDILAHLQTAFDEVLPQARRQLQADDDLLDLGVGSVAALEMAASLEAHYSIRLPEERLAELRTVGDFVELVRRTLAAADGTP